MLGKKFAASAAFVSALFGQSQSTQRTPNIELPAVMHWCAQHCTTLTLDKGAPFDKPHYGNEASGSIIVVERFTRESVIMHRTDSGDYPGTAILKGQLSADGNTLKGTIEWTYHPCCGAATYPFEAAWGKAISTVPGSDAERDSSASGLPNRTAAIQPGQSRNTGSPTSRIWLPPGASPEFASFPADIRAVLRPEPIAITARVKPSCANANILNAAEALEFGKFAFRALDFTVGNCLAKHSADIGNARANVILGVAEMMGWGTAKDGVAALHSFDAAAAQGDAWGTYFAAQCVKNGIGTAVNMKKYVNMDTWLSLQPKGQEVYWAIGADDSAVLGAYERLMIYATPPTTVKRVCTLAPHATQEVCHDEEKVNEDALQSQLREVDRKYGK